jgi:hypothetical protein
MLTTTTTKITKLKFFSKNKKQKRIITVSDIKWTQMDIN